MGSSRHSSRGSNRGNRRRQGGGKNKSGVIFAVLLVVVVVVGGLIWWAMSGEKSWFSADDFDRFVESEHPMSDQMPEKVAVYLDFSDGMQHAYKDEAIKDNLKSIVNKLTGTDDRSAFYSMANDEVTPLEMSHTQIYNHIVSDASYRNTNAPIEKTLDEIVRNGQPAIVITDFEEYNNGKIQHENYAKDYFVKWLQAGNDITFYIMDYKEGAKDKHLYFAVFDGKEHRLLRAIEDALKGKSANYARFSLGASEFPVSAEYPSATAGGNYHSDTGADGVTGVLEKGDRNSFRVFEGRRAEFYPLGVNTWEDIVKNAKALSEEGVSEAKRFSHLLSHRFVDLSRTDGYVIKKLGLKVTNVSNVYRAFVDSAYTGPKEGVEVKDMLTLADAEVKDRTRKEIKIDLDEKFNGKIVGGENADLYRVDVVVAESEPALDSIARYFAWAGNTSLSESVRNTLQSVSPEGQVIYTYYIKIIE